MSRAFTLEQTQDYGQKVSQAFELENADPVVPAPVATLRRWLLGALLAWQVGILWLEPARVYSFGSRTPRLIDLPLDLGSFEVSQFGSTVVVGVTIAVGANLGFLAGKLPLFWLSRLLLIGGAFSAAMMGSLATFSVDNWIDLNGAHAAILGTLLFVAMTLGWSFFPGLRSIKLVPLGEAPSAASTGSQFRLIHLFYLISATAILLAILRLTPTQGDIGQILHEPVELAIIFGFLTLLFSVLGAAVQYASLGRPRRLLWLGVVALLTPLFSMLASIVVAMVAGQPLDREAIAVIQVIFAACVTFSCGAALALRLIGYRIG